MSESVLVDAAEMRRFMLDCLLAANCDPNHANDLVDLLIDADRYGHFSHGLNRIQLYLDDLKNGTCLSTGQPEILKESESSAWVDGRNLLGPVVGKFCIDLAIKKAKTTGIACVACKGSNHFGIGGYYANLAAKHKMIGMAFTNGSPLVAATNGKSPFLSTNPLSVAAQGNQNTFMLDIATSGVSYGKVEMQDRKGEPMPPTWAIDKHGKATTDPKQFHALMPLGGLAQTGGYKGYGLGVMVEMFAGLLSGAVLSPDARPWTDRSHVSGLGHCFIAVDTSFFAPDFTGRLDRFAEQTRGQEPADSQHPVLFPGDPEVNRKKLCEQRGDVIAYHVNQIKFANDLAKKFSVNPPKHN